MKQMSIIVEIIPHKRVQNDILEQTMDWPLSLSKKDTSSVIQPIQVNDDDEASLEMNEVNTVKFEAGDEE